MINIQPLGDIAPKDVAYVVEKIRKVYPAVQMKPPLPLPAFAFHAPRNRYRADSILRFLKGRTPRSEVTIALTNKDISTTKDGIKDWGVMGLGHRPGNACVASTFRLAKKNKHEQLFKVAIHELGHTQGLPHCPDASCFMRDAEGGNPTDEEKGFCISCKRFLIDKGWQL